MVTINIAQLAPSG